MDRLERIIKYNFDLELLLKAREAKVIELELERAKEIRACLEKLIINEVVYPDRFVRQEYQMFVPKLKRASSVPSFQGAGVGAGQKASSLPNTPTSQTYSQASQPGETPKHQYEMRADGRIVKLRCPECHSDNFKSMLGFLNHCRIHCRVIFSGPEDRHQRAGVLVEDGDVPADFFAKHPTILKQQQELAIIRADLQPIFENTTAGVPMNGTAAGPGTSNQSNLIASPDPTKPPAVVNFAREDFVSAGEVTRFCIHKRLVIGNTAKMLRPDEAENPLATHSWKLYLRLPPATMSTDLPLGQWIRFVRFYLHPSYKESRVVEVHQEPFELVKEAFGEFPVRIQLHFWDSKRNKPFDIIHHIKVFQAVTLRNYPGPERMHEVELDRNTDFTMCLLGPNAPTYQSDEDDEGLGGSNGLDDFEILRKAVVNSTISDLRGCELLIEKIKATHPQFSLDPNQVLSWLTKNHSNSGVDTSNTTADEKTPPLKFCCYCGQPHQPAHRFEVLQKHCSHKPRKVRLSSKTEFSSFVLGKYALSEGPLPDDAARFGANLKNDVQPLPFDMSKYMASTQEQEPTMVVTAQESKLSKESRVFLNALVRVFSKRLIARSITSAVNTKASPRTLSNHKDENTTILTPLHVYNALTQPSNDLMDFITLENMQA